MNLEKLKDSARKFEQKEDWRKAIEVYLKAIQQIESGAETSPDLSLYNRVGDLYLKISDTASAVRSYERAVDLYADQGFFNNAIALCGKILRVNPGRTQTYLKLAQLHARKNVVIEAKRNLIEFLERMNALGQLDQAFQSVKEFADQFSGSQEIRMMLVELLRAASREEEALEQLAKIAGDLEARAGGPARQGSPVGEGGASAAPASAPRSSAGRGDLIFLDTGFDLPPAVEGAASAGELPLNLDATPPEGLESTGLEPDGGAEERAENDGPAVEAMSGLQQTVETDVADATIDTIPGLEVDATIDSIPGLEIDATVDGIQFEGGSLAGLDQLEEVPTAADAGDLDLDLDPGTPLDLAELDTGLDLDVIEELANGPSPTDGLPLIASAADAPSDDLAPSADDIVALEDRIVEDPDNPALHSTLAERLLDQGDLPRAAEELRLALQGYEFAKDWIVASSVADRMVALEPDAIHHHQKRVELAFRTGERSPLLDAYLALGDALVRAGSTDKALAVFGRVLEHDPDNPRAAPAIQALTASARSHATMATSAPPASRPAPAAAPPAGAAPAEPATRADAPASPPTAPPPPVEAGHDSFVDLGSMIFEESTPRDTRMRVDRHEPRDEDEQREFKEILEQFKRGIEANLETDDYQAHYDLGVAFKEMGLLDEAIAEFQKALRAPDGRLRTSEALGMAFFEKGQFAVSEAVLRRAVDSEGGDEAKIGLIYWMGRALEAQGKGADAVTSYERAMAVDIRFLDLGERIQRLTAGRRE